MLFFSKIFISAIIISSVLSKKPNKLSITGANYLLPNNIIPLNYKIFLNNSGWDKINNKYFLGEASIDIKILQPTLNVTIHKKTIQIISYELKKLNSSRTFAIESEEFDKTTDQLILKFKEILHSGYYNLNLYYIGKYGSNFGIFRRFIRSFSTAENWLVLNR